MFFLVYQLINVMVYQLINVTKKMVLLKEKNYLLQNFICKKTAITLFNLWARNPCYMPKITWKYWKKYSQELKHNSLSLYLKVIIIWLSFFLTYFKYNFVGHPVIFISFFRGSIWYWGSRYENVTCQTVTYISHTNNE